ncbi:hypothetical protein C440_08507 [Haloferax mucosum ATCC BAA-1512]|uniref:Uncharacterized protein n=1 Tax=Haloferax mucosum ATCC BAA-1512 TaxID=662479 RepID=M0II25_9EURY|nr:hypothetical protein [Haloferax mucosum]ELZ95104.1 hypothetical protein C440_08507 [Haloferax mucosum ATCC BAA-1512]
MADTIAWVVLVFVPWFGVSVLVGIDATKHSSHNAFLWGFSVFAGGVLGLALYLNLGRDEPGYRRVDADAQSRSDAGVAPTRTALISCPNCHSREAADRDTCRFCGESLDEREATSKTN